MDTSVPDGAVLAPTDLSAASLAAVTYAASLARQAGVPLVLLHVVSVREIEDAAADGTCLDALVADARDRLLWWYTTFAPADARAGVPVKAMIAAGHPGEEILDAAEALCVGTIVMATRIRSAWGRLMHSGVARDVVRRARCPVVTIRTGDGDRPPVGAPAGGAAGPAGGAIHATAGAAARRAEEGRR